MRLMLKLIGQVLIIALGIQWVSYSILLVNMPYDLTVLAAAITIVITPFVCVFLTTRLWRIK